MTSYGIPKKLIPETKESLEEKIVRLYRDESKKLFSSIRERCEKGVSAGLSQAIGRRFGYFWEEMVKHVFEYKFEECDRNGLAIDISALILETIEDIIAKDSGLEKEKAKEITNKIRDNLNDILETGVLKIADLTYKNQAGKEVALEIKWRVRWNDAKTVKAHALAAHRLKNRGFQPIMLIKRPKEESFDFNIDRFEREGWKVLTGKETMDFICEETMFDLNKWIEKKVDFWREVSPYQERLKIFTLTPHDFEF
jgi:hypothetical protein